MCHSINVPSSFSFGEPPSVLPPYPLRTSYVCVPQDPRPVRRRLLQPRLQGLQRTRGQEARGLHDFEGGLLGLNAKIARSVSYKVHCEF